MGRRGLILYMAWRCIFLSIHAAVLQQALNSTEKKEQSVPFCLCRGAREFCDSTNTPEYKKATSRELHSGLINPELLY